MQIQQSKAGQGRVAKKESKNLIIMRQGQCLCGTLVKMLGERKQGEELGGVVGQEQEPHPVASYRLNSFLEVSIQKKQQKRILE